MAQSIDGLKTTVKNVSSSRLKFPFLPPHGRELAAGESVAIDGDLLAYCARKGKRYITALQNALKNNQLDIVKTRDVVLYDAANDNSKTLDLNAGILRVVKQDWDSASV